MALTLHTYLGNFRAFKALIAAEYNGVEINIPKFEMLVDNKKPEFLALSPMGRVPVLETPQGAITESNAIARHIARIRRDTELMGATLFENAQVDQWIDFCTHEIELPATIWFYPVIGYMPFNSAATEKAKVDLKKALALLEAHLTYRSYLVGNKVTLADITVVSALIYPMKIVLSEAFRKEFPCVMRWFNTCVNQPQFKAVVGAVTLAKEELTAAGGPVAVPTVTGEKKINKQESADQKAAKAAKKAEKKEKAPAPAPKKAEKEPKMDDEEPPAAKKEEHPLKLVDAATPSHFQMDPWKKEYSNCVKYEDAMAYFWDKVDLEGYSLWFQRYKYNSELKVLFKVCNMCGSYLQYTDPLRKWSFGVMWIVGDQATNEYEVIGMWLLRTQEGDKYMLEFNCEAEMYDWEKIPTPVSEADKKKVFEMWCSTDTVLGKPVLDCKVFK